MNIYDKLNDLTKAISESSEFISYKNAAEAVNANEQYSQMVKEFITVQMQISTSRLFGQEPPANVIEQFNTMYNVVTGIETVNNFLQCQMRFSKIMEDITKEVSKVATLEYDFLNIMPNMNGM